MSINVVLFPLSEFTLMCGVIAIFPQSPMQMYSYRPKVPTPVLRSSNPSSPAIGLPHQPLHSDLDLPIAFQKGAHPSHFVSYDKLTPFCLFALFALYL